ncbi:UDP-glycosyltransferase 88B1-like [Macadamia integrifolia]|uniref:UDP-glycosyltransferase 88B1-like n=1 Tax=Macadamia integrifolia TaxID=60698 RepID=UPI001C4F436A|nr:UDP-glycosyltransferase 88B1-like [Macadamia integrifolia]
MQDSIVLYPSPGIGHLIGMVEFGRFLLHHYPSFSITILITTPPTNLGSTAPYIRHISTKTPSIIIHHLPIISLPPSSTLLLEILHLNNPNVHHILNTISLTTNIRAFIIDFFCTPALDVATSLNIPTYYFFPSGGAGLAVLLHFPIIHNTTTKSFIDLNTHIYFPGVPPIPASDMPEPLLDRTSSPYQYFLDMATHMQKSKGIIVNTFEALEARAIKAISDGICIPNGPTPPVYAIGPLIADNYQTGGADDDAAKCLTWLNSQPSRSVIFLSFGSLGLFSAAQLKEIAIGLENSGHRFLWVLRSPPTEDTSKHLEVPPDPILNLDDLLPEGFMERTKDRGLVVQSWAPQIAVLSRESVGAFVTHCGWNSVLEAVCAGVPMIGWPLYAEQRMNRVFLLEEMKLAIPMDDSKDGFVSSTEVEKRVRQMMDSEEGKALRERVMVMRDAAMAAKSEGGSSRVGLAKLAESWNRY